MDTPEILNRIDTLADTLDALALELAEHHPYQPQAIAALVAASGATMAASCFVEAQARQDDARALLEPPRPAAEHASTCALCTPVHLEDDNDADDQDAKPAAETPDARAALDPEPKAEPRRYAWDPEDYEDAPKVTKPATATRCQGIAEGPLTMDGPCALAQGHAGPHLPRRALDTTTHTRDCVICGRSVRDRFPTDAEDVRCSWCEDLIKARANAPTVAGGGL